MKELFDSIKKNGTFVLAFLGFIIAMVLLSMLLEFLANKKNKAKREKTLSTRKMAVIGMFSAMATILMLLEFPIGFAPDFYKMDFSEVPILIGAFAYGPVAGVIMEFIKILLKLFIKGTTTAFVGDFANFIVGCSFIIPAASIYYFKKTKARAVLGCVAGAITMVLFGTYFNAVYLVPTFADMFGVPMDVIIEMGKKVNPLIKDSSITSFVIACVAPFNVIKSTVAAVITMFIYKPLSPIIKATHNDTK